MNGATFKQAREILGLSLNDMAEFLGYNERTLRRWEYGHAAWPVPVPVALLLRWMVWDVKPEVRK